MAESNGLLDLMKSPAAMGLLAAGFGGLAGAGRNTPFNNLGRAGLAGIAGYSAADSLQQKQRDQDKAAAIQAAIPTLYGENGSFDYKRGAELGIKPADLKGYAEAPNAGRAKVARTISVPGINGGKQTIQLDDYGQKVGDGVDSYVAPQLVDTGDSKQFVTPQAGQSFGMGMSPSQRDASARGWASNARQEANSPFMSSGGQAVPNQTYQQYQLDKAQKGATQINTAETGGYSDKPLPIGALKVQDEALSALGSAGTLDQILAGKEQQIKDGKLSFGPIANITSDGRNAAGFSSDASRNYASFKSDLERMRNESLRLNSGVQTDGDAQRAWNELFQNTNDTDLVSQRLGEIRKLNARAAELQRLRVDGVRTNYNAAPYDFSKYDSQSDAQQPKDGQPAPAQRAVTRTGMSNGRKVIQYSDGSTEYAD
jgi:hypothetical protein